MQFPEDVTGQFPFFALPAPSPADAYQPWSVAWPGGAAPWATGYAGAPPMGAQYAAAHTGAPYAAPELQANPGWDDDDWDDDGNPGYFPRRRRLRRLRRRLRRRAYPFGKFAKAYPYEKFPMAYPYGKLPIAYPYGKGAPFAKPYGKAYY